MLCNTENPFAAISSEWQHRENAVLYVTVISNLGQLHVLFIWQLHGQYPRWQPATLTQCPSDVRCHIFS